MALQMDLKIVAKILMEIQNGILYILKLMQLQS